MASIIQKRKSLHKALASREKENSQLQLQLGQLQALANIGISTSMIAHELNNLLTPLANYAQLALQNPADKELANKVLQKTSKNCTRASKIMTSILSMTKKTAEEKSNVNVQSIVEEIFNCLCRDFSKDKIAVKIDIPSDLTVRAVGIQIQQAIMNLILNARDAMLPAGGTLTIRGSRQDSFTCIEVSDTGCGIEPDNLPKIFDPFFTTKSNSDISGSGLGLALCKKIIDAHNGTITVESQPGKGSTFIILLPSTP